MAVRPEQEEPGKEIPVAPTPETDAPSSDTPEPGVPEELPMTEEEPAPEAPPTREAAPVAPREYPNRDAFLSQLKDKYPETEDEDDLYGRFSDDLVLNREKMGRYEADRKTLTDLFNSNPASARFFTDWVNGTDPVVSLVRNYGLQIRDYLDDPDMQDKLAEANRAFLEGQAESRRWKDEYARNADKTRDELNKLADEKGYSDEQMDAALAAAQGITMDAWKGIISPSTVEMIMKALTFDQEMEKARTAGELAGRNQKIEDRLIEEQAGDGIPQVGSAPAQPEKKNNRGIFGIAEGA